MKLSSESSLLPIQEATRLLTLQYYDVVNSLAEPVFNEFAALANNLLQVPIARLSLIDSTHTNYLAGAGLPGPAQLPRDESICVQVLTSNRPVIYCDLEQATTRQLPARVKSSALANGLRFYAGVPLHLPNQAVIGSLCVLDKRPRSLKGQDQYILELLAGLIERAVVVHHSCLTSRGLGPEYWRLSQEYIVDTLHRVKQQLEQWEQKEEDQVTSATIPDSVLQPAIQQLNKLMQVLTEPLPGFA